MKKIILTIVTAFSAFFFSGCNPNSPLPVCTAANSSFNQLYTTLAANPIYQDINTMDLVTHEYTFTLSINKTVCSIGYQGNANLSTQTYLIEIVEAGNNVLYSGNHLFSSTTTQYVALATPVALNANTAYTIRRHANNYLGNIGNTTGRMLKMAGTGPMLFPYTAGAITITGSNFYGTGGPAPNFGIPFIDIVFQ